MEIDSKVKKEVARARIRKGAENTIFDESSLVCLKCFAAISDNSS